VFRPALKRARIRDLRWKDFRHTFAARLRMQNADLQSISELLGHTTTRMTEAVRARGSRPPARDRATPRALLAVERN